MITWSLFMFFKLQFSRSGCWKDRNRRSTSSLQIRKNINSEHMWKHLQPATDTNRSNSPQEVHNIQSLPKSRREVYNRQNLHFDWCHYQQKDQVFNHCRQNASKLWKEQQRRRQHGFRLLTVRVNVGPCSNIGSRISWTGPPFRFYTYSLAQSPYLSQ